METSLLALLRMWLTSRTLAVLVAAFFSRSSRSITQLPKKRQEQKAVRETPWTNAISSRGSIRAISGGQRSFQMNIDAISGLNFICQRPSRKITFWACSVRLLGRGCETDVESEDIASDT